MFYVVFRILLVMFCVLKFYFVDFNGMFTFSPTWRLKMHVLCKVGKNIIFQNKTLLVMFYRHNKTFWYQFCNFKHFRKAESSEDSMANSCEEFSIGFHVPKYETIGTRIWPVSSHAILWLVNVKKISFVNRKDFLWVSANHWDTYLKKLTVSFFANVYL